MHQPTTEEAISEALVQIREVNNLLQNFQKIYQVIQPLFFNEAFEALSTIRKSGRLLEEQCIGRLDQFQQKNIEKQVERIDASDVFILLSQLGLGIKNDQWEYDANNSYVNLLGCQAQDLYLMD